MNYDNKNSKNKNLDSKKREKIVINFIKKYPGIDRTKLSKISGIPRSTLYDIITRLQNRGELFKISEKREKKQVRGKGGRPRVLYHHIQ